MKPIGIRYAEIYHNGKTLNLEIEYYKTVAVVYIFDKTKYWEHVDTIRIKRGDHDTILKAREICIEKGYF